MMIRKHQTRFPSHSFSVLVFSFRHTRHIHRSTLSGNVFHSTKKPRKKPIKWKFIQNVRLNCVRLSFHRSLWGTRLSLRRRFHTISLIRISIYRLIFIIISSWYSFSGSLSSRSTTTTRAFLNVVSHPLRHPIQIFFGFPIPLLDKTKKGRRRKK